MIEQERPVGTGPAKLTGARAQFTGFWIAALLNSTFERGTKSRGYRARQAVGAGRRAGSCLYVAVCICAAFPCTLAIAGPPFITDDPEPVDFRAWEINYGLTYLHAAGTSSGSAPSFDINYGIYPGIQLHLQPQAAYACAGAQCATGAGDTEIGMKYRLTPDGEDKGAWMLALYPMLEIPTGSARRGLGSGAKSLYLPLWAQTTRGNWTVFGGGGYRRDAQVGARNSWAGGATALYQVSTRLQLGAEVFGATRASAEKGASIGTNIGGVYDLREGLALLFSAGRGLRNRSASNQGAFYLGLRTSY